MAKNPVFLSIEFSNSETVGSSQTPTPFLNRKYNIVMDLVGFAVGYNF